jgi:hypothetical protein
MRWQPQLEFFIDNYKDIAAVVQIDEKAREALPEKVGNLLKDAVAEDMDKKSWQGFSDEAKVKFDEETTWWSDPCCYDWEADEGAYFGVWPLSVDALINAQTDGPVLYLGFSIENKARRKKLEPRITKIRQAVRHALPKAKFEGFRSGPPPSYIGEEIIFAHCPIGTIVSLDALQNREEMTRLFVDQARAFTEALAPSLIGAG